MLQAYLHTRPPKLEDHGKRWVVYELGPAVRSGAGDAGHEDEGEADQDADEAHQVPRLLLTILSAEYEWVWSVWQPPHQGGADPIRQLSNQQYEARVIIVKVKHLEFKISSMWGTSKSKIDKLNTMMCKVDASLT